jgi:enoyl-CoA hydratase/carnithine racemase
MVGADTSEFFPALDDTDAGVQIATDWSRTARRLEDEFETSVGVVIGKRCLGGFLELLAHCRYLVSVEDAQLGFPEVTLPVVPGMEGCHWTFRKARPDDWQRLLTLLLGGRPVAARAAVGWLIDYAGPMEETVRKAWQVASGEDHGLAERKLQVGGLATLPEVPADLADADGPQTDAARRAILACITEACACDVSEALGVQARHAAGFLASQACRGGRVGAEFARIMSV